MTTRQWKTTDKKGRESIWEWEETPEVLKAIEVLHSEKTVVVTPPEKPNEG
tara:strand:+ start:1033 stop:1185 length:153 start_codon:yes stop_codon:yes gene_type:complete